MKEIHKQKVISNPSRVRLSITTDIMGGIRTVLSNQPETYFTRMMWAACCIVFFGFLHSSEFTISSQQHYDPKIHLFLSDVTMDSRNSPSMVCIHIKQSKTEPFRESIRIYLGRTHQHICPVDVIIPYLAVRRSHPGPVFILPNGRMFTRDAFGSALDNILAKK